MVVSLDQHSIFTTFMTNLRPCLCGLPTASNFFFKSHVISDPTSSGLYELWFKASYVEDYL